MLHEVMVHINTYDTVNTYFIGVYNKPNDPTAHVVLMQHPESLTSVTNGCEEIARWAVKNLPELQNISHEEIKWYETYWAKAIQLINNGTIISNALRNSLEIEDVYFKKDDFEEPVWQLSKAEEHWLLGCILHDIAESNGLTVNQMFETWAENTSKDEKRYLNGLVKAKLAPYGYNLIT